MRKIMLLILVLLVAMTAMAQQRGTVKGVVTDENGTPLAFTNVVILDTNFGAATNMNGEYTFNVPAGRYEIQASYVGYNPTMHQDIVVISGSTITLDFTLKLSVVYGQEIVVIGYGVQQKKDLTGSATTIRVDDVQKIAATEVSTAIQGRAAGVNVSQTSGAPGVGAEIKIRGAGTLGNTFPLVIVDGVPSSLSSVNPQDIASFDILKDASAAAIYGSRAGNGVLIITTRRGHDGPVKINFSTKMSLHSLGKKFDLVTDADDYIQIVRQAADNAGVDYPEFVTMYEQSPSQFSSGTDWQDAYFRDALMQDYDLSISGGSKNATFSIAGNYSHQEGIVVTTKDERMGMRINSDFTAGRVKIGESFSLNRFIGKGRDNASYSFFSLGGLSPMVPVHDENNPTGWAGQDPGIGFYREIDNIVANMHLRDNKYDNLHILASAYLEYRPMDGLTYTARLSQNIYNNYSYSFAPSFFLSNLDLNEKTSMSESRSRSYHTVMDHTLNYNGVFGDHSIDAMAGYSEEETSFRSTGGSVTGFPDDDLRVLDAGSESDDAFGYASEWHYRSYFGRINYSFADRYLFQANIRRDGSSRFSKDNRWGNFPSVSAAWRISNEPFFKIDAVNDFKVRASYGELGMQEFGNYMHYFSIASDHNRDLNYPFGPGKEQAIGIGARAVQFPSIGLKWESSKQTNVGFDLAMLNNKLTLEFDYYIKKNEDILFATPIPLSAGSSDNPTVNAANVENRGIELAVNYRNMDNPFKYEINFTATTYDNEVTRLGRQDTEVLWAGSVYWALDQTTRSMVGQPLAPFYLFATDGIFKSQTEVDAYLGNGGAYFKDMTPEPGDVIYLDLNEDGVINADDKKYFGTGQPGAEFGANFNFSYKQFDFNMFLYGVTGKEMLNGAKWLTSWTRHAPGNYHTELLDAWTPDNADSNIPRVIQGDDRNAQASDMWLEDADYLRLRHIEIGYTMPASLIYGFGIQSMRIYLAAENMFTLTNYSGYDPAIDGGSLFSRGVDRSPYPVPRQIITGIQIGL
ncbi:TonB-dependent receptor [bacterium]|nr:TonB-dependent receptor [bacterium]